MKFEYVGISAAGVMADSTYSLATPHSHRPHWRPHESTENYPVVSGEFTNVANGFRRRLGWSQRIVRRGNGCRHDELLKAGRREHEEVVIRSVAGITQFVRDVARG